MHMYYKTMTYFPHIHSVNSYLSCVLCCMWFIKEGVSFMQLKGHVLKCQFELVMGLFIETASFMLSFWPH